MICRIQIYLSRLTYDKSTGNSLTQHRKVSLVSRRTLIAFREEDKEKANIISDVTCKLRAENNEQKTTFS